MGGGGSLASFTLEFLFCNRLLRTLVQIKVYRLNIISVNLLRETENCLYLSLNSSDKASICGLNHLKRKYCNILGDQKSQQVCFRPFASWFKSSQKTTQIDQDGTLFLRQKDRITSN